MSIGIMTNLQRELLHVHLKLHDAKIENDSQEVIRLRVEEQEIRNRIRDRYRMLEEAERGAMDHV